MKVGYVVVGAASSPGVVKKIDSQVALMNSLGVEALPLIYSPIGSNSERSIGIRIFFNAPILRTIEFNLHVYRDIVRKVRENGINLLYVRSTGSVFFTLLLANKFSDKLIFELNSIRRNELELAGRKLLGKLDDWVMARVLKKISGVVAVTNEILDYYRALSGRSDLGTVISNGVDVGHIAPKSETKVREGELNMLFVGNFSEWFGIDRLIEGMKEYQGSTKLNLVLVGEGHERWNSNNINVEAPGKLLGEELDAAFEKADIAIGSLGLHRVGLSEACTLKVREYWARGIPFILSYDDVDLVKKGYKYFLKVPSDNSPIDFDGVVSFYKQLQKDGLVEKMRKDAIKHIDTKVKMTQLVKYFNLMRND